MVSIGIMIVVRNRNVKIFMCVCCMCDIVLLGIDMFGFVKFFGGIGMVFGLLFCCIFVVGVWKLC